MRATWPLACLATMSCFAAPALAQRSPPVEVRFCPAAEVRPYPLDDTGRLQSLEVPGIVIINRSERPFRVEEVDISLLDHGRVLDRRVLGQSEIERWVGNGPPLQKEMRVTKFEFGGEGLVPADITLAGPTLNRSEGILVVNEVFAYDHARDAVRVDVRGAYAGNEKTVMASVPIVAGFAKTRFAFALKGTWWVGWGPSFHTGHRAHVSEEFALDIAKLGTHERTYRGDGLSFSDYYAFGAPVLAAAGGRVVRVQDHQPQDPSALQRPGESAEAYAARHNADALASVAAAGPGWAVGNYVMIDHDDGEYSLYAHLQPGSIKVKVGNLVKTGDVLGNLGSSGNSSEPHLHFQVCDKPDPLFCAGIPVEFSNVSILWADRPRAIQSGDVVTAQ